MYYTTVTMAVCACVGGWVVDRRGAVISFVAAHLPVSRCTWSLINQITNWHSKLTVSHCLHVSYLKFTLAVSILYANFFERYIYHIS